MSTNGSSPNSAYLTLNCLEQLSWYVALNLIKLFFCYLNCKWLWQFYFPSSTVLADKVHIFPLYPTMRSLMSSVNWYIKSIYFFFNCNQWLTITSSTLMLLTFALWKSLYYMAPYPQLSQWKSVSFMPLLSVQMLFLIQRSGIRQTIVFFFLVSCLMQTLKNAFDQQRCSLRN